MNRISPININVTDKLPEEPVRTSANNLFDSSAFQDFHRLFNCNFAVGGHKAVSINCGGDSCGNPVVQVQVSFETKVPDIWYNEEKGYHVDDLTIHKVMIIAFNGDGIIDAYVPIKDQEYYLVVNFDDHSWGIEDERYVWSDMIDVILNEAEKFPVK